LEPYYYRRAIHLLSDIEEALDKESLSIQRDAKLLVRIRAFSKEREES
jgi:hypothetical protein